MALTIAAAQSASRRGDVSENLARHLHFGIMAAERGVQLLVFPELSLTGYEPDIAKSHAIRPSDPRLLPLRRLAEEARMTIVVGAPLLDEENELHIAALAICPDNTTVTYTKEHLHPSEEKFFSSGRGGSILQIGCAKVALAICADTSHPLHAATAKSRGANVYAAGVLFSEKGYDADAVLLSQYSRQHQMAVLIANHSAPTGGWISAGRSSIWSERGTIVAASPGSEESLVIATKDDGIWHGMVLPVAKAPYQQESTIAHYDA